MVEAGLKKVSPETYARLPGSYDEIEKFMRDYLGMVERMHATASTRPNTKDDDQFAHKSVEGACLALGTFRRARVADMTCVPMQVGKCFTNIANWLFADPAAQHLHYVEGFALLTKSFPVHHAWAEDDAGNVYDPTWLSLVQNHPEHASEAVYIGLPIRDMEAHLEYMLATGHPNALSVDEMVNLNVLRYGIAGMTRYKGMHTL